MVAKSGNWHIGTSLLLLLVGQVACDAVDSSRPSRPLSIPRDETPEIDGLVVPKTQRIGALSRRVPIRARPSPIAAALGYFTAGASVGRSDAAVGNDGCVDGWYAVAPRGFVCADAQTTSDPSHPTLQARGLLANRDAALPYPYAMARRSVTVFEPDPTHQDGVRERGRMSKGSIFAVVGSWETLDEYDQRQRLALLTLGAFVPARDIEPLRLAAAPGFSIEGTLQRLPVGVPLTSPTPYYAFVGSKPLQQGVLDGNGPIPLTVKTRTFESERYLLLSNDHYVAERDVTVVHQRQEFPAFVTTTMHWLDIDVARGILVMYVGEHPSFVTRTRIRPPASIARGTTWVKSKQITDLTSPKPITGKARGEFDVPWIVQLETGLTIRSSFSEGTDASQPDSTTLELHPEDAAQLFRALQPAVPEGWHGIVVADPKHEASAVLLR